MAEETTTELQDQTVCYVLFVTGYDKNDDIFFPLSTSSDSGEERIKDINLYNLLKASKNPLIESIISKSIGDIKTAAPNIKYIGFYWALCVMIVHLDRQKVEDNSVVDGVAENSKYITQLMRNVMDVDTYNFQWAAIPVAEKDKEGNEGLMMWCNKELELIKMIGASGGIGGS